MSNITTPILGVLQKPFFQNVNNNNTNLNYEQK